MSPGRGMRHTKVLPRLMSAAGMGLDNDNTADAPAEDGDTVSAWKLYCQQKQAQSAAFLVDPSSAETVVRALVVLEPLEHFSQRMQHLDTNTHALQEMTDLRRGLPHMCCVQLFGLMGHMAPAAASGAELETFARVELQKEAVFRHFERDQDTLQRVMSDLACTAALLASQVWSRFVLEYSSWPWRLIRAVKPGPERDETLAAFFNECPCCLDEWFSMPFRATYPTQDDMDETAFLLLQELSRRIQATNMPIENLFARHKSALPRKCQRQCMETWSHVAYIAELMREHLKAGFPNPLLETRSEMQKSGVPLLASFGKVRRRQSSDWGHRRDDVRWRNKQLAAWRSQNPGAGPEARAARVRELAAEWRSMTDEARAHAVAQLGNHHGDLEGYHSGSEERVDHASLEASQWRVGDDIWPVSPRCLEAFVGESRSVLQQARVERPRGRARMFVQDVDAVPSELVLYHRSSCSEKHPGLCATRDEDVYDSVVLLARNFERYFRRSHVGHYFALLNELGATIFVYLACVRARRCARRKCQGPRAEKRLLAGAARNRPSLFVLVVLL